VAALNGRYVSVKQGRQAQGVWQKRDVMLHIYRYLLMWPLFRVRCSERKPESNDIPCGIWGYRSGEDSGRGLPGCYAV
jgi:hypothetical protein